MPLTHPIPPLYDRSCRTLILGSFPSVASRAGQFYYHHPRNRFWQVMAAVLGEPCPETVPQKRSLLLGHGIALWDVVAQCEIHASDDASIRDVQPNDLSVILQAAPIERIFCNGNRAYTLYRRLLASKTGIPAVCLPSTSPANAAWTPARLIDAWRIVAAP